MVKCSYCELEFNSNIGHGVHSVLCKLNPNRKATQLGRKAWNKGLSKDTDERVKKNAENIKQSMIKLGKNGNWGFAKTGYWTTERRKQKSDWKKQLHLDFPEIHPNRRLAGNRNKMTYPEKVANDWFISNNILVEHNKHILNFYVDFCVNNIIIEIDGEYWHPIDNEKDLIRDQKLNANGYTVYRIRSKENINKKLEEIFSVRC